MSRAAVLALVLSCASAAAAQTHVYRCGADGRSYSQEPCQEGRSIDVADSRTAQQAAQARQATQHDARQAHDLERARLQAERRAASQGPAVIGWSKSAGPDATHCAKGAHCKRSEPSKRRSEKTHTVTLYRGAEASR